MKKEGFFKRLLSVLLCLCMLASYLPAGVLNVSAAGATVTNKVADDSTIGRVGEIYGNDTYHAGKISVDKSVSAEEVTVGNYPFAPSSDENFIVTISQAAQVMALTTEMDTPVDVVFVLDTSGSMSATVNNSSGSSTGLNRSETVVNVVNDTIKQLMAANEYNRVAVVAFSAYNAGGVDAGGDAANVLSPLGHYDGTAATEHLTWDTRRGQGPSWATDAPLIRGRDLDGTTGNGRAGYHGATNIQAGLAKGAELLMNADTTVEIKGQSVTRMPFLIFLSDGAPVTSSSNNDWTNPSMTLSQGTNNDLYAGNSFLPLLVATYYKQQISQKYYPKGDEALSVYTMGFSVDEDEEDLCAMTLNPAVELTNTQNEWQNEISQAWKKYSNNESFSIQVGVPAELRDNNSYSHDGKFYFYHADTEVNIRNVNDIADNTSKITAETYYGIRTGNVTFQDNIVESIIPSNKSIQALAYNDGYFDINNSDALENAFDSILTSITEKTIASPTRVTTGNADFDGYVTFTDVIGEYMEVKDMKGIIMDGIFFQGASFAQNLSKYGTSGANAEFDDMIEDVVLSRMNLTGSASNINVAEFAAQALASNNQAYYNSSSDFDNSLVWWGNAYTTDDGFETKIQTLAFADDDSIEFIEAQKAADRIPNGANCVVRSYFFYGEAGGTISPEDANHELMYFIVQVQRSLTAPYQQTVIISAPASLLSVDKVYITENKTDGASTYTAKVEDADTARVVYEVGLRDDINAYNVAQIVGNTSASTNYNNYDAATGNYYFYTNDWDHTENAAAKEQAMSKATFYAAADNPYYTYQENTYLCTDQNDPESYVTDELTPGTYYYFREVYTWSGNANSDGEYVCTKSLKPVAVTIDANTGAQKDGTGWYIPAGYSTAAVISAEEDVDKDVNRTGTAQVVAHPHRTGDGDDAHYTVYLGNNGKLTLTPQEAKTVQVDRYPTITDADGKAVMVGETLTYKVQVHNSEHEPVKAIVTDSIPSGTTYVANSAEVLDASGAKLTSGYTVTETKTTDGKVTKLEWTINAVPANTTYTVIFQVVVDESALSGDSVVNTIDNTATIQIGNDPAYTTNTTHNPPEGKKLVDTDGNAFAEGETVKVGDVLVYRVRYANDTDSVATVTITDVIPRGTTYVDGSADHGGVLKTENGNLVLDETTGKPILEWTITNVAPHTSGIVSFRVVVDASAKADWNDGATQPVDSQINIPNQATIIVNEARYTNIPEIKVKVGDLTLNKVVATGDSTEEVFTLYVTESGGKLHGTYNMIRNEQSQEEITFTNGVSEAIKVKANDTVTIKGIPEGAVLTVSEDLSAKPGWTATYNPNPAVVTIVNDDTTTVTSVTITNDYNAQPVSFQLTGIKTFSGVNFPAGGFSFTAAQVDKPTETVEGSNFDPQLKLDGAKVTANVTTNGGVGNEEILFSRRTFYAKTERYYLITENPTPIPGVTISSTQYLLYLKVTDDSNGRLVLTTNLWTRANEDADWAVVDGASNTNTTGTNGLVTVSGVNFTNTYAPKEVSFTIDGSKTLTGRYLKAGEFSFQLIDSVTQDTIATVTNGAGNPNTGTFAFPAITIDADMFDAAYVDGDGYATFTYYVREVSNAPAANTTYDRTYYEVVVTVVDNNGKLEAKQPIIYRYEYGEDGYPKTGTKVEEITYKNSYTIQDTSVTLTGEKVLTGEGADGLTAGEFSFSVYRANASGNVTDTNPVSVGANDAGTTTGEDSASITFAPIGFTYADMTDATRNGNVYEKDFHFLVVEDIPTANTLNPNMLYSSAEYLVKVTVTYRPDDGTMKAEAPSYQVYDELNDQWTDVDTMSFTNIQNVDYVKFAPTGQKTTTGDALPEGLRFSFRVYSLDTNSNMVLEGTGISGATSPVDAEGTQTSTNTIVFTDLEITDEQFAAAVDDNGYATFVYYIQESNAGSSLNGIDYDKSVYRYTVVITRDETNALVVDHVTYAKQNAQGGYDDLSNGVSISFNNRYKAETYINLTAAKVLEGGLALGANAFGFRLQRLDFAGKLVSTSAVNGYNDKDGLVTFATLNYSTDMLDEASYHVIGSNEYYFSYLMSEIHPATSAIPGVEYDGSMYVVTIKITQESNLELSAELANVSVAVYNAATDSYTPGTPVIGFSDSGKTYVTFTNKYTVRTGTEVEITASKSLTGRELVEGEFGFNLARWDEDARQWKNVGTAFNDASGNVSFTRIYNAATLSTVAFDANGLYTVYYRVNEANNNLGGITYSGDVYYVDVVIRHNQAAASYEIASVTYYAAYADGEKSSNVLDVNEVVFANTYDTNDVTVMPEATKEFLGANGTKLADASGFSFQVVETDENGQKIPIGDSDNQYKVVSTGTSGKDGKVTFSPIHYTNENTHAEGKHTHYYVIEEVKGKAPGVTYSEKLYYFTVEVTDNGKGLLTAGEPIYYSDAFKTTVDVSDVVFTNHWGSGRIDLNLDLEKIVDSQNGEITLSGAEYDFNVYQYVEGDTDYSDNKVVTTGTNGATVNGVAPITFGSIVITEDQLDEDTGIGTFQYYIKEVALSSGSNAGISIDPNSIIVTVTVTDDGYGNLTPEYAYEKAGTGDNQTFVNNYTADPAELVLRAAKILNNKALWDKEFSFKLTQTNENFAASDGAYTETVENSAPIDGSAYGLVEFSELTYTEAGTYYYVVEEIGTDSNYTYDTTVYRVIVTVTDDLEGNLHASAAFYTNYSPNTPVGAMVFTNSYTPPAITENLTAKIGATKEVVNASGVKPYDLLAGFEFQVTDVSGKEVSTGTSNENGEIVFEDFTFNAAGEYVYTIKETSDKHGFTTDPNAWTVYILVRYNAETGNLYIDDSDVVAYLTADIQAQADHVNPVFVNTYNPDPTSITLNATKTLTGRDLRNAEFTFRLMEGTTIISEVKNTLAETNNVAFTVNYTEPGEHTYTMVEVEESLGGVTYTKDTYSVTVKVTDKGEGKLVAEVIEGPAEAERIFENTYITEPTSTTLAGRKVLEGRALKEGEFSFVLKQGSKELATVKNNVDGTFQFADLDALNYTAPGTYTYTIEEVKGEESDLVYDGSVYDVTVTVVDDGAGKLRVSGVVYSLNGVATGVVFRNATDDVVTVKDVFDPNDLTVSIDGKVVNDGDTLHYVISYINYTGKVVEELIITDEIPSYTSYVDDSADNGGVFANGVLTWTFEDVAPGAEVNVSFDVIVDLDGAENVVIENQGDVLEDGNRYQTNVVTNLVPEDGIVKDVFHVEEPTISIDGDMVQKGDILLYTITYTNSVDADAVVTITDQIPAYASFVNVYDGGVFAEGGDNGNGYLTWKIEVAAGESKTVRFEVKVEQTNVTVVNQAVAWEGENGPKMETNIVTNPVPEAVKDVFHVAEPTVSIDGDSVRKGDVLLYTITYVNPNLEAVDVTITDTIPEYTSFVQAYDNGTHNNGVITWTINDVAPGATVTVRFEVEVTGSNAVIFNGANIDDGENKVETNIVTNPVPEVVKDVFHVAEPTVSIDGETVQKGDVLLYTVTYTNPEMEAVKVTITDKIPAYTRYVEDSADNNATYANRLLTWVAELDAGESITVTFKVEVVGTNVTIENQASALEGENVMWTNIVTNPVPEDKLEKDVSAEDDPDNSINGENVEKDDVLLYTITYTNSFDAAAKVTITDTIPAHTAYVDGSADNGGIYADGILTWTFELAAGESKTVSFRVKVVDSNVTVENQAIAWEGENGPKIESNVVENTVPEDSIVKDVFNPTDATTSIDGLTVETGEVLLYKVTYTNSVDAAADVTITDVIPAYTSYVDGSADNGGVFADGVLTWKARLEAGESITVSFKVKVTGSNVVVENQASALEAGNTSTLESNIVRNPVPEDKIVKDVAYPSAPTVSIDGKNVAKDEVLLYTITYTNSIDAAAKVTITDTIPAHTVYVDGSADNGGIYADGTLTWTFELAAGESKTVRFWVKVVDCNVTIENQAIAWESENGPRIQSNPVKNIVPEDSIVKDVFYPDAPTISIDGQSVEKGEVLLYKVTYTNSVDAAADVTITDVIPAYTSYVDGSADNGGVFADGVLTWKARLEAGESFTVSFKVAVNSSDVIVMNVASAVEAANGLELVSNTVVNPVPEDKIVKDVFSVNDLTTSIDGKVVQVGDILLYKVTYTNSFEAAADVTITDAIPQYTSYVDGSASNGGTYANGVLTWVVHLEAGERITVSFKVKTTTAGVAITNQASAVEGANDPDGTGNDRLYSNTVTNKTPVAVPDTGDSNNMGLMFAIMGFSVVGLITVLAVLLLDRKKNQNKR